MTTDELNAQTMAWLGITEDDMTPYADTVLTKKSKKDDNCTRCNCTGYIQSYKYHKGGICFKCNRNA